MSSWCFLIEVKQARSNASRYGILGYTSPVNDRTHLYLIRKYRNVIARPGVHLKCDVRDFYYFYVFYILYL